MSIDYINRIWMVVFSQYNNGLNRTSPQNGLNKNQHYAFAACRLNQPLYGNATCSEYWPRGTQGVNLQMDLDFL